MEARPPIFIGGVNRSGTSLVRQLVGSHPEVALPPTEFEFFKRFAKPIGRSRDGASDTAGLVDGLLAWPKVAGWGLHHGSVLAYAMADPSPKGLFVAALRAYADKLGKPRFGDKTTDYERQLHMFDRWFGSDYAFVHVLRHPVSTFASGRWYGGVERQLDPRVWARQWRKSVLIALRALRAREGRYVVIRYEDLVGDPEGELRRICAVARLEYDDRMLTMADFPQKENSSFGANSSSYNGLIRSQDAIDRASWIPARDLDVLKQLCRLPAALVGYDVDAEGLVRPFPHRRPSELRVRGSAAAESAIRLALRTVARLGKPRAA